MRLGTIIQPTTPRVLCGMQAGEEGWCWDGEGASHISRQIQLDGPRSRCVYMGGRQGWRRGESHMLRSEPETGGSPSVVPDQQH